MGKERATLGLWGAKPEPLAVAHDAYAWTTCKPPPSGSRQTSGPGETVEGKLPDAWRW